MIVSMTRLRKIESMARLIDTSEHCGDHTLISASLETQ